MDNQTGFSIILPCYNQQEYLEETIQSAMAQTAHCQIIFISDGANDGSLEIAKRYPIKIIEQVNKGLASARNTGLMNAEQEWILPLDCDDKLLPNAVERILEVIKQNPDADIIAPSFKEFGLSDREVILMKDPKLEDFKTANRIGYCAAIRRSALLEIGGYSPKMVEGYEDLALTINLLTRGKKLITIPEVLWMYRTKEESMYTKITPEIHKKLIGQINKDFPESVNF